MTGSFQTALLKSFAEKNFDSVILHDHEKVNGEYDVCYWKSLVHITALLQV